MGKYTFSPLSGRIRKEIWAFSALFVLISFSFVYPVNAQTPTPVKTTPTPTPTCQALYGGGTSCTTSGTVTINKTVENPKTQEFTNNLLQDMYVFSTGETVTFRFTLTNVSSGTINNIHILDTLPANLDYVKSDGSFNSGNRTVSIPENTLPSKASASFQLTTKVNSQPIPGNQSIACLSNITQAQTTSFFFFNHTQAQNTAVFCLKSAGSLNATATPGQTPNQPGRISSVTPQPTIHAFPTVNPTRAPSQSGQTKGGQKVYSPPATKKTPATGPEALGLLLLPICAFFGRKLRRLANKYDL